MAKEEVIIRFDGVSFKYSDEKIILDNVSFSIRKYSKITIMGQNGAGKSTLFKMLSGKLAPDEGKIHIDNTATIAIAEQFMDEKFMDLSILEYFNTAFTEKKHGIEKDIKNVFEIVNVNLPLDKKVRELSGGQKARLLLAYALIQEPDILLLDEPTNNLDKEGIEHLTNFLMYYWNTCIVISHDADFLNAFTDGVLNLDVHTHKTEQFVGNYFDVLKQIEAHIENQRLQNARIQKSIRDRFEKINKLGGKSVAMRRLANKVREDIEEDRQDIVEIRKEDKTIPKFEIPFQNYPANLIEINTVDFLKNSKVQTRSVDKIVKKGAKLIISGPNGIGKSTLLKSILNKKGVTLKDDLRIGYYSQDFSELDFNQTVFDSMASVMLDFSDEKIYETAGRFLLTGEMLKNTVRSLSEGQKGLLCYARFVLQEPGLLIMDEPTNHINFRHIPIIADALAKFRGGIILVSHVPDFVQKVGITDELDLTRL